MKHQAGYTLLELLVVLVIMGLLISVIPGRALPGIDAFRFSGKMQEIISRLSSAHEESIETGQTIILEPSDFVVSGVDILLPPRSPKIIFFPDGTASPVNIEVEYSGRRLSLTIDPVTGAVAGP
jgi:prepilin-type N-terminal cleavage/methylation domain-containing protein